MKDRRRKARSGLVLMLLLAACLCARASVSATATITVGGSEQQQSGVWDSGSVSVSFVDTAGHTYSGTVVYGQYSTPNSIASTLGAMFSNSYLGIGLCAQATNGGVVTFQLTNGATFGGLQLDAPGAPFTFSSSGFTGQYVVADHGTIELLVNAGSGNVVAASTTYGYGSTPSSVAAGLAAGMVANSPVGVTAEPGGAILVQAAQPGSAGNSYSYTLETTSYDTTDFPNPSFMDPPADGGLAGGANENVSNGEVIYSYNLGYTDNSNIATIVDAVTGTWTYSYDPLSRLAGAQQTSPGTGPQPIAPPFTNYCWSYDSFGNRTSEEGQDTPFVAWGGTAQCLPENPQPFTYNTSNQISGGPTSAPQYDQAGNIKVDYSTGNSYLYDGEGRICAVQGPSVGGISSVTAYIYDAEGRRVAKAPITSFSCNMATNGFTAATGETDYILGLGGEEVTQMTSAGNDTMLWNETHVYAGGALFATYNQNGLYFRLTDWLGSLRGTTNYAGALQGSCGNLPYGDQMQCPSAPDNLRFTGKERDTESGNDYFGARYYSSAMGRFMSPDWAAKLEGSNPVPYANLEYPQTLNLYSYAGNNPLSRTDPDGHCTNGGKEQGFFWCLFHDSDQDAARAREQLAQYKNISINGKTPADAAKGLNNTQTVQLERSVFNYISSQAMSTPGMMLGLAIVPGGAEEVGPLEIAAASDRAVAAGEATQWIVQTGKSALATDIRTNITAAEFGTNLEASGFVKSVAKDGVTTLYSKGDEVYSVYSKASSTGGAAANLNVGGQIVTKIRLQ